MREIDVSGIRILLYNPASVIAWCEVLNCTEEELLNAINTVGNSAKDVDEYLESKKKIPGKMQGKK